MILFALGINHNTAPVAVREQVAFNTDRLSHALGELRAERGVREAAILSTCNRTELYCGLERGDSTPVVRWLSAYHTLPMQTLEPYLYLHPERAAVRHLLRVAAGLDSMVLGEPQILGQVKNAYQTASNAGTLGFSLERLFQHSFAVAKRVRTDTAIGASAVSVAFAAVSLSKQIFADLSRHCALLIGAGETIELVARHLHQQNIGRIIVANRTYERARALAVPSNGYAITLTEIPAHLAEADIVISSTASSDVLLKQDHVKSSLKQRKHRPMFMVDLAVPRDIDPTVAELPDAYLYTVDDLQSIIEENLRSRREAAEQAEEIIDAQVDHFMQWLRAQSSTGHIRALRQHAESVRDEVMLRAMRQLEQGKSPEQALQFLANTLTNKLIHAPSSSLREAAARGELSLIEAIKQLYKLDD